jgi:membrane fusion protein, copper/silver efflux system
VLVKRVILATLLLILSLGSFWAGSWYTRRAVPEDGRDVGRKILYYADPMHPAYKSDKPGIAPDCGMELVPVYADGSTDGSGAVVSSLPPGMVSVSPERQQLIGVRVIAVEKAAWLHTLRVVGRVSPDENRLFRLNASTELWIRKIYNVTTGNLVKKDEPLLGYYATNFLSAAASYLYALETLDRQTAAKADTPAQLAVTNVQIRQAVESLQNLGVSDVQIEEMARTRKIGDLVTVRSPTNGFVLLRSATLGQWVGPGTELYQIADLSHVWVYADFFENEAQYLRPGVIADVRLVNQKKTYRGTISSVPPDFDNSARTLRVRLEVDNPGFVLRPGMFVDVELPVTLPTTIAVPADAVVDAGAKKVVYVAKGDGVFEPRKVETGWRAGDQVEIVKGLMAGEKIVVSGTFLIDSESRMKAAAAGIYGESSECPVCGMEVDITKAKAAGLTSEFRGQTYYFCVVEDKARFDNEPVRYAKKSDKGQRTPAGERLNEVQWEGGK